MYHIQANYEGSKWECIDTFETLKETKEMMKEYREVYKGTGQALRITETCKQCREENTANH